MRNVTHSGNGSIALGLGAAILVSVAAVTSVPLLTAIALAGGLALGAVALYRVRSDRGGAVWADRNPSSRREDDRVIQEEYAKLEERYQSIVEHAGDIIFSLALDGSITSVNPAVERVLGFAPAEWIGHPLVEFIAPEEVEKMAALFGASHAQKLPRLSATVIAKDGTRVVIEVALTPQTANGDNTGFYGVARDVTESRNAAERIRSSDERFRLVARATNDAVYDWTLATGELWWSDAFYFLFGYEQTGNIGDIKTWEDRIHPDDRRRVLDSMNTAMDTGQDGWSAEYRFRKADGNYALVLDRGYILRNEAMEVMRFTGAVTDMTERKQLEDQLAHSRRVNSLGRVAASIAHEFNNVLMGIQPNVELMRRRATPENRTTVDHIVQSVQRGKRVTEEILRFTRPSEPALECVHLTRFLSDWEAEIRPVLGPSIDLRFNVTDPELYMLADGHQVAQVMTNLALNARDAMPGQGQVTVTAALGRSFGSFGFGVVKTPDGYVHISVADNGRGMTPEEMGHLFEPLFTTKRGGTGLGLAISYQLVARLGGHIFVESEVGKGTTFHLMIPATHPALNEAGESRVKNLLISRERTVEDQPAVRNGPPDPAAGGGDHRDVNRNRL